MSKFFTLITTHKVEERDSFYYNVQLKNKELSIGWGDFDPTGLSYAKTKSKIEYHYPSFKGTTNPDSGAKSLPLFLDLSIGDIVFVRGVAKIIDIVIITGKPIYDDTRGHYANDYYLKVPFVSLFDKRQFDIHISSLTEESKYEIVYEEGRSTAMKELGENTVLELFKLIRFI